MKISHSIRMPNRRDLLRMGFGTLASYGLAGGVSRMAFAATRRPGRCAETNYRALVCIFLFGGNDGHNVVIPMDSRYDEYSAGRGGVANLLNPNGLALAKESLFPVANGTEQYGLHPSLAKLAPLYNTDRKIAVVANVGMLYEKLTRDDYLANRKPVPVSLFSHSDQQMQWQTGVPNSNAGSGWGGRAAELIVQPAAIPATISVSGSCLLCNGATTQPAVVNPGSNLSLDPANPLPGFVARNSLLESLAGRTSGIQLMGEAGKVILKGLADGRAIEEALRGAPDVAQYFPPATGFLGQQLLQVTKMIYAGRALGLSRQLFFCSLGGFDTHVQQIADHASLLSGMGEAMFGFHQATQAIGCGNEVVTFTESEFGRSLTPSSAGGSDHGWGSHHLVMGGPVAGGRFYGSFPSLTLGGELDSGSRGTLIPTTSFDEYGATLARWFGIPDTQMASVFPNLPQGAPAPNLGFLG